MLQVNLFHVSVIKLKFFNTFHFRGVHIPVSVIFRTMNEGKSCLCKNQRLENCTFL